MARPKIRFAFTIASGPNQGLTSGGWRVWTHGESTYIASRDLGGMWKASLHADDAWRFAVTKEHHKSADPVWTEPDRAPWTFQPTSFVDGRRLGFVVATFRHALLPRQPDAGDTHIAVADRWDELTAACVWMTEPGVDLTQPRRIGGPLGLSSGRRVWVTARTEKLDGGEPEPMAVSTMVEPVWPEEHGVASPGVLLRGVHLDSGAATGR